MKSIQAKLTIAILIIAAVALTALGGLNYWEARSIITGTITNDMAFQAEKAAGDIDSWLESRKSELAFMALSPTVQNGNTEEIVHYLATIMAVNKIYDGINFATPGGTAYNAAGTSFNVADRVYFQHGMRGETKISDPLVARDTGHFVAVVAVPVKTLDGEVKGVLFAGVNLEEITKKVLNIKVGQSGYAYVIQNNGLIIFHPNKDIVLKNNGLDQEASPALQAITKRMVNGEKSIVRSELEGVERLTAFAPLANVSWSLAITVPVTEITGTVSALARVSAITTAVVLILAVVLIIWYARRMVIPIRRMVAYSTEIATGDLTEKQRLAASSDEIGQLAVSLGQMRDSLRGLIGQITADAEQMAAASEELTANAEQSSRAANQVATSISAVAAGAMEQMNAADEATVIVEQISASVQQVSANTSQVATQSAQAAGKAENGGRTVTQAVDQMEAIQQSAGMVAAAITKLNEKSKEIGLIVDTIAGIAGQTNLLALNAAIEAARAGEQGRGFAVVAEEVRKLAENSQEAAKQIATLINEIQGDTGKAVEAMNNGAREVQIGTGMVTEAGNAFKEIAGLVTAVASQVQEISTVIEQVAVGSRQIVRSVRKIDEFSKKTAGEAQNVSAATEEQLASMEEIASSSEALAKLAQELQAAVTKFKV